MARFLLRNSAADRLAGSLSGGERLRAALAGYDGALLVVSHDPDFREGIGVERTA